MIDAIFFLLICICKKYVERTSISKYIFVSFYKIANQLIFLPYENQFLNFPLPEKMSGWTLYIMTYSKNSQNSHSFNHKKIYGELGGDNEVGHK